MLRPPAIAALLALGACVEDAALDPGAADREAYTASAALLSTDPAAAGAACREIADPVLQGDCATFAAKEMAKAKLDPLPLCADVRHTGWQEVCFFESVDAAGLFGDTAIHACQRAGGFRQRCLSHALGRETDREWRQVAPGQEGAFVTWIEGRMPVYGLDKEVEDIPRDFLARRIADRIAAPGQRRRFARADCGDAPEATCTEAYRFYVRKLFRQQDMRAMCEQPVSLEAVEAAGLPGWEDDFAESAPEMWRRLCRELTGGGRPPRGRH
jgi:hypothetical protein